MFARVETFTSEPAEMDDLITSQHHAVGLVRTLSGNMGGYVLVDRDSSRVMNVTFWKSEEERDAAEGEFEAGARRGEVARYAIAMQESLKT